MCILLIYKILNMLKVFVLSSRVQKSFLREAEAMFKLTSPHVVHIYGILVEPDPGLYAIVMEHMVHGSISDVIEVT